MAAPLSSAAELIVDPDSIQPKPGLPPTFRALCVHRSREWGCAPES